MDFSSASRSTIEIRRVLCNGVSTTLVLEFDPSPPEVHQHLIHRQSVQPCREGRIAAKASDLLVDLQEDLLSKIFRVRAVPEHPQTERVDSPMMLLVQFFKRRRITSRCCPGQLQVRRWLDSFAGHGHCQRVCDVGHDLTACDAMTLNPVAPGL